MDRTGVAHAFKPTDVCGGGQRLDECETAEPIIQEAKELAAKADLPKTPGEGRRWNVPVHLSRTCGSCSLSCQVAYETEDGIPTGITRLTTARPLEGVDVVRIDVAGLRAAELTEDQAASLRKVLKRLQGLAKDKDQSR